MIAAFELGGFEVLLILIVLPLFLAISGFWIWMLVSAITNKGLADGEKVGWVIAIALLHFIGALLYLFIGYPKRNAPPIVI